jgi:protein-tyrosine-phosphatase
LYRALSSRRSNIGCCILRRASDLVPHWRRIDARVQDTTAVYIQRMWVTVRTFIRRCVALGPRSGSRFVIESAKRAFRVSDADHARPLIGCRTIIFACHGNILRSPFAAAFLAHSLGAVAGRHVQILSAGLRARPGRRADGRGIEAAADFGVDLSAHLAQSLTRDLVRHADAVVVMDFANHADFLARYPDSRAKLRLLAAFDPGTTRNTLEIADPYMLDAAGVRRCYDEVARCIEGLAAVADFAGYARVQEHMAARSAGCEAEQGRRLDIRRGCRPPSSP